MTENEGFNNRRRGLHRAQPSHKPSREGFDVVTLDSLERSTEFAVNRLKRYGIHIVKGTLRRSMTVKAST
ncbi:hypothetical protein [Vulcanisaeta sp. JCM 14467]